MTSAVGSVPGSLIDWAAGIITVPSAVVAAQINEESGGNPSAVSPTGAQGVAQFEPGTWASQGCKGQPQDVNAAMECYANYMNSLVVQFHGNIRDALAAYNAGPANLSAGYGYADTVLAAAGQPQSLTSGAYGSGGTGNTAAGGGVTGSCLVGPFPHTSWCILDKSEARAFIGGALMVAGALIFLPGLVILVASGFRGAGGPAAVSGTASALGRVPVYGRAVRRFT